MWIVKVVFLYTRLETLLSPQLLRVNKQAHAMSQEIAFASTLIDSSERKNVDAVKGQICPQDGTRGETSKSIYQLGYVARAAITQQSAVIAKTVTNKSRNSRISPMYLYISLLLCVNSGLIGFDLIGQSCLFPVLALTRKIIVSFQLVSGLRQFP